MSSRQTESAEGSGSLPWTSRVPLPQASCLLTPGPSDLTGTRTRKQRGPEEQKWVLGGTHSEEI